MTATGRVPTVTGEPVALVKEAEPLLSRMLTVLPV